MHSNFFTGICILTKTPRRLYVYTRTVFGQDAKRAVTQFLKRLLPKTRKFFKSRYESYYAAFVACLHSKDETVWIGRSDGKEKNGSGLRKCGAKNIR